MKKKFTLIVFVIFCGSLMSMSAADKQLVPATFENLDLGEDSYWYGDIDDEDYSWGTFNSGSFEFLNFYMADYQSWAFYGYSNLTSAEFTGITLENQMKNCVGSGHDSGSFGICYCDSFWGPAKIAIPDFEDTGVEVNGMWITNTAWVEDAILNGDGMESAFGQGDWLKVTITGTDVEDNEKTVDFYLADYRSENPEDHYYIKEWHYLDLSSLGKVVKLQPTMSSSKCNDWGMTTPAFFAFDDLGAIENSASVNAAKRDTFDVRIKSSNGVATVCATIDDFDVEAMSVDGLRISVKGCKGEAEIVLPSTGINLLRITSGSAVKVVKILK